MQDQMGKFMVAMRSMRAMLVQMEVSLEETGTVMAKRSMGMGLIRLSDEMELMAGRMKRIGRANASGINEDGQETASATPKMGMHGTASAKKSKDAEKSGSKNASTW
jgi:hypothetical protein